MTALAGCPRGLAGRVTRRALPDHRRSRLRGYVAGRPSPQLGDDVVEIDQEVDITDPAALFAGGADCPPRRHLPPGRPDPCRAVVGRAAPGPRGERDRAPAPCWPRPASAARDRGSSSTSSAEVYGAVTDPAHLPLTEESPTAPLTPYAASKLAAEALVAQAWLGHGQHVIDRPALQPHRSWPVPQLRGAGPGQAHRGGRPAGCLDHPGRQPLGPAGLHRRTRRGPGLPAPDRVRAGRPGLQRLLGSGRVDPGDRRRAARAGRAPPSSSRSTRRWCGRSRCPCCGVTRAGWPPPPGGSRRSRWTGRSPTCSPTGVSTPGLRATARPARPDGSAGRGNGPHGAGRSRCRAGGAAQAATVGMRDRSWVRASLAWSWACLAMSRACGGSRSSKGAKTVSSRSMSSSSR